MFLSAINFLRNFSFKNQESEKAAPDIFNWMNPDDEFQYTGDEEDGFELFRQKTLPYLLNRYLIGMVALITVLVGFLWGLEISLMLLVLLGLGYFYILNYPRIQAQKGYDDLNQELPYALRHMGIELKSGKGLHDALITVKNSNYGSLSREFNRVLEEVRYGRPTEESLLEMSERVKSEGLSRTIHQIVGTLRVGGNLANSLEIIAKDITFDMHIKLKEYSQKLNSFILIYTFLAILIPVIGLVMLMAATTVIGDVVPANVLLMVYSLFFPLVVVFMGIFIKKLEPKI